MPTQYVDMGTHIGLEYKSTNQLLEYSIYRQAKSYNMLFVILFSEYIGVIVA